MKRLVAPSLLAALLVFASCGQAKHAMTWEKIPVRAQLTGVTAVNASNRTEALGYFDGDVYHAPNGRTFEGGVTVQEARILMDAQDGMAQLKEVIAYAPHDLIRSYPECELSNLLADKLMEKAAEVTGRTADVALSNFGGIRVDIYEGPVLRDDLVSMFPFKNYLTYAAIRGTELKRLFDDLAAKRMQVVGGVQVVVSDHRVESLLVGGEPVQDDKLYGLATIDFLLDGGDGISVKNYAEEIIKTDVLIIDVMLPYVESLGRENKPLEYKVDGRVIIK